MVNQHLDLSLNPHHQDVAGSDTVSSPHDLQRLPGFACFHSLDRSAFLTLDPGYVLRTEAPIDAKVHGFGKGHKIVELCVGF